MVAAWIDTGVTHMSLRVYLVEDSPIVCERLQEYMHDDGATVVGHAEDAATAITEIAALCPDVVVVDIALREGTGFHVLDAIGDLPEAERPACIVLTKSLAIGIATPQIASAPNISSTRAARFPKCWTCCGPCLLAIPQTPTSFRPGGFTNLVGFDETELRLKAVLRQIERLVTVRSWPFSDPTCALILERTDHDHR